MVSPNTVYLLAYVGAKNYAFNRYGGFLDVGARISNRVLAEQKT